MSPEQTADSPASRAAEHLGRSKRSFILLKLAVAPGRLEHWAGTRGVCLSIVGFLVLTPSSLAFQDRPQALKGVESNRAALRTAHVEWSWWKPLLGSHFYFYTSRIAGDDFALDQRGNEDGLFARPDGDGGSPPRAHLVRTLRSAGQVWHSFGHGPSAEVYPAGARTCASQKIRALGISFHLGGRDVSDTLWYDGRQAKPRNYTTRVENGLHVVRAATDHGEITWWIDPERGWSPVHVALSNRGEIVAESRSTLKQFDGVWFPENVLFFRSSYKDGKEPCEIVRVHSASFNQPEHPQRLRPKDIGIDACFTVGMHDENAKPTGLFKWDGEKIVTIDEWNRRQRAGEVEPGPHYQRLVAQGKDRVERARERGDPQLAALDAASEAARGTLTAAALMKRSVESKWEKYTRRFVEQYELNQEQSNKAWAILRDCQERANRHLAKRERDFERLAKEAAALRESDAKDRTARLAAIDKKQQELTRPIDEIFQKQLKPRLERLPTRTQRQAAEAASKPARPGDGSR